VKKGCQSTADHLWERIEPVMREFDPPARTGRKRSRPRRWVVERTLAWLNRCRAILVRYEKKARNYLGLIKLACILFWYRRTVRLCVLR